MNSSGNPIISAFADESSQDFGAQLDALRRNNITHIELRKVEDVPVHKQSLDRLCEIKQRADDAGKAFSAVGSGLGKAKLDEIDDQIAVCRHLVEAARVLETPYIRMF